jgi:hypothetical protein
MPQSIPPGLTKEHVVKALNDLDGGIDHPFGAPTCAVVARRMSVDLAAVLSSLGLPPEALPEQITRINLGQEVEFRDGQGTPAVLWHDPRARRICVREAGPAQPAVPVKPPPVLYPKCTAGGTREGS